MKAILIDSTKEIVKDVKISGSLQSWYDSLGVNMVETAHYIDSHDSIMVDEEGLLKPLDKFFTFEGAHQPFAGNGLVVGTDKEGESVDCNVSAKDIRGKIKFFNHREIKRKLQMA